MSSAFGAECSLTGRLHWPFALAVYTLPQGQISEAGGTNNT
jgi:hypothetical protein